jgi:hypothetical protein
MTSIEWFIEKIGIINIKDPYYKELFEQAKEMHKQEILNAFTEGANDGFDGCYDSNKEKYYQETFKK